MLLVGAAGRGHRAHRDRIRHYVSAGARIFRTQPRCRIWLKLADRRPRHRAMRARFRRDFRGPLIPIGPNYEAVRYVLSTPLPSQLLLVIRRVLKLAATICSLGSGGVSAMFVPLLLVGGCLGSAFAQSVVHAPTHRYVRGGRDGGVHRGRLQNSAHRGGLRRGNDRRPFVHHPEPDRRGGRVRDFGRGVGLGRSASARDGENRGASGTDGARRDADARSYRCKPSIDGCEFRAAVAAHHDTRSFRFTKPTRLSGRFRYRISAASTGGMGQSQRRRFRRPRVHPRQRRLRSQRGITTAGARGRRADAAGDATMHGASPGIVTKTDILRAVRMENRSHSAPPRQRVGPEHPS